MDMKTCDWCGKHTENYIKIKVYVDCCLGGHVEFLCLDCCKQRNKIFTKTNKENDV